MKRSAAVQRTGKIAVLVVVMLPILFGMAAFAIDVGYIAFSRSRLQAAAEASALAAVEALPDGENAVIKARDLAELNFDNDYQNVVATQDVEFGIWAEDGTFATADPADANAVRVTAELSDQNGTALALFFGGMLGSSESNIAASAIAARPEGGIGTRFLIDEDMFDKDVPSIESVANALGRDPEELVTARGFNAGKSYGASNWTWEDNFLDIPDGTVLVLPTGQGTDYDNNDAGLFDIDDPSFPFISDETFMDFLFYSETGGDSSKWGTDNSTILGQLDPLYGVIPITDDGIYASFVDPEFIHVSPVFPSDISTLNMNGGIPQVNAKGLRRGLLAFKIIAVGDDIDGSGSVLPELQIEVVDPSTFTQEDVGHASTATGGGGTYRIVQ